MMETPSLGKLEAWMSSNENGFFLDLLLLLGTQDFNSFYDELLLAPNFNQNIEKF